MICPRLTGSYMTCFVENNLSNIVFSLICGSINFHGNGMVVIFIQPRFADYVFARQVVPLSAKCPPKDSRLIC
jgi:hypothetical protein